MFFKWFAHASRNPSNNIKGQRLHSLIGICDSRLESLPDLTWKNSQTRVTASEASPTHGRLQALVASLVKERLERFQRLLLSLPGIAFGIGQDCCAFEKRIDINAGE
jgi:hypothetical protein